MHCHYWLFNMINANDFYFICINIFKNFYLIFMGLSFQLLLMIPKKKKIDLIFFGYIGHTSTKSGQTSFVEMTWNEIVRPQEWFLLCSKVCWFCIGTLEYKFKRETLKVEAAAKRSFLFLREEEGGRDLLILWYESMGIIPSYMWKASSERRVFSHQSSSLLSSSQIFATNRLKMQLHQKIALKSLNEQLTAVLISFNLEIQHAMLCLHLFNLNENMADT